MQTRDILFAPVPKSITHRPGVMKMIGRRYIHVAADASPAHVLLPAARQLLKLDSSWEINAGPAVPQDQLIASISIVPDPAQPEQGYKLSIEPGGAQITASTPAGAFYGACTLLQILRQSGEEVPCLYIEDWPDYPDRGVMIDISRDKVPTMDTLYGLVDMLAEWKINHFELYIEHTFAYLRHPKAWAEADPMTGEQILELDEYCRERFVQLVPNQNSFSHMLRWLQHDEYRPLCEAPDGCDTPWGPLTKPVTLCATDPASLEFLGGLYDELLPHFSSELFNVGCDEALDVGCGRSAEAAAERGWGRVYLEFVLKINDLVKKHGRKTCFWADIMLHHPELIPELPKDIVGLIWGYEADHPFADECAKLQAADVAFYVCPGTSSWRSFAGRTQNAIDNITNAAQTGLATGAIGLLNTDWGDGGNFQPLAVCYAGFMMGAMAAWNAGFDLKDKLGDRLSAVAFQDSTGKMGNAFVDLGNAYLVFKERPVNSGIACLLLANPVDDKKIAQQITPSELDKLETRLTEIEELAIGEKSASPDAAIVRRELETVLIMMRTAATVGRARLGLIEWDRAREAVNDMFRSHEQVWLLRNRPGGLKDSVANLEHLT